MRPYSTTISMKQERENNPLVFEHKFIDKHFDCAMISVLNALLQKSELFLTNGQNVVAFYSMTDNIMEDRNVPRDAVNRTFKKLQDLDFLRITDRAGALKVNKRVIKQIGINNKDTTKYLIFDYHKMTLDENLCILFPLRDYDEELQKAIIKAKAKNKKKGAEDSAEDADVISDEAKAKIRAEVEKYNEDCREHRAKFKRYAEYMEAAQDEVIKKNDCREALRLIMFAQPSINAPLKERRNWFIESVREIGDRKGYNKDTCNEFYLYWTELTPEGDLMRYELKKSFDISERLRRYVKSEGMHPGLWNKKS